ncbi:YfhO family protein [soil metagenome]
MKPRASRRNRAHAAPTSDASLSAGLDRVPVWVPPVLFAVLTLFLFRSFAFSREMLFGMDTMTLGYQARLFFAEALRTTGFPLWNPHILGGTPFIESLAGGDSLHPLSVALFYLVEPYRALGWKLVIHVFLAGIFMFGWLRMLGCSRGAALVGGTGALLAPSFVTLVYPGHDGKMFVVAMTPLLFWLAEWMWRRRDLVPGALLALSIGTVLFSTHFQMDYFLFGALGAWMLFRAIQVGRAVGWKAGARGFSIFLAFSLLGAGTAAIQLLPAVSYVTDFSRRAATTIEAESPQAARDYSSSWSLHPEEAMGLVVPEFVGNSAGGAEWTTETYWGRNAFKLNHEYLGAVLLVLALLAFLPGPAGAGTVPPAPGTPGNTARGPGSPGRWFLAGLALVAALFALGAHTPVWRVLYEVIPGISLFRAPSMAIFLTAFAVSTLAALGLDRAVHLMATEEGRRSVLRWTGGAAGVLALGGILAASGVLLTVWEAVLYPNLPGSRVPALEALHPYMVRGFFVVAALAGLLAAALWGAGRGKLAAPLLLTAVTALVVVDMVRINAPFIQVVDPTRVTVPDPNLRFLEARTRDEPPFRVFSMVQGGQDVQPSAFGIDLAAGHHPNDLGRYRDLIGMTGSGIPEHLATFHPVILAILNVRYVLWPDAQYGALEGVEPVSQVRLADGRSWASVYPYPGLPRARLVGSYRQVAEGDALAILLDDESFDPRREVLLEAAPAIEPEARADGAPHPPGAVRWIEDLPDRLVLEVETEHPSLLVVSQNWFPSWVARVSGESTPVLRADHALQAVAIPAGRHRVELAVESSELQQALLLSGISLLVVLGAGLASGLSSRRAAGGGSARVRGQRSRRERGTGE